MTATAFVKAAVVLTAFPALALVARLDARAAIVPMLTYLEEVDELDAGRTSVSRDTVSVDARGNEIRPDAAASRANAADDAATGDARGARDRCTHLALGLAPVAAGIPPGVAVRSGALAVAIDGRSVSVPVTFAVTSLSGTWRRVGLYGDADASANLTGALDFTRGVLLGATITIATSAQRATRCRLNLILPPQPPAALSST